MIDWYILDENKIPVKATIHDWEDYIKKNKIVAQDYVELNGRELFLSTVFLGLDHSFTGEGTPVLFETMLFFKGEYNELYMERYTTYEQALDKHNDVASKLRDVSKEIEDKGITAEEWIKETISS